MCAMHPADQLGFSVIAAGIPFAARRSFNSVRGSTFANVATVPRVWSRSPIRTVRILTRRHRSRRAMRCTSKFDMGPHDDGPFIWQMEDLDGIRCVARDGQKQLLAPFRHPWAIAGNDLDPGDEVARVIQLWM